MKTTKEFRDEWLRICTEKDGEPEITFNGILKLLDDITELERKLAILRDTLVRVHNNAGVTYGWQVLIDQALASIQAEGKEESEV